ncbi:hypothetical protein [Iningainema tapete]|uniref:Uncharacterized protein n=1 Tax=Iningainema tapete BLCC-T55 TaxID=2748662 RepID=A0A8J6XI91_9CYAN|nr:hypothetical protein [Iningainema tapete]MBD2771201.1 hypothetical protein [Iningainema tapete BLCC-T55]
MSRIRNKNRPLQTSFCTTYEQRNCANILASCLGISLAEFVHRAICSYNQQILDDQWNGISPEELLSAMRSPKEHLQTKKTA